MGKAGGWTTDRTSVLSPPSGACKTLRGSDHHASVTECLLTPAKENQTQKLVFFLQGLDKLS